MGESHLPEPIIQHIQSFLTGKEAAQTTLLSKSWREAWLTRPNLAFVREYNDFKTPLWELARKTIQRYEESNLNIQSLTLHLDNYRQLSCEELIAKSLKLGATHLNVNIDSYPHFVLPHGLLFGSKKLVGLSVNCCKIETGSSDPKVIRCSGLESLCLSYTEISPDTLSNIICCPSIRNLSLSNVFVEEEEEEEEERGIRSVGLGLINLHSLTSLKLSYVDFDTLFLGDMSSRFPSLKDLTLHINPTRSIEGEIRISCRSLERLKLALEKNGPGMKVGKKVRFRLDVPSIRRFTYEGRDIPLLSFKSTPTTWESRVSIGRYKNLDSFWFRRLNKFLTKLRRSKIHLSLKVGCVSSFDYEAGEIQQGLPRGPARVDNLTVDVKALPYLSCYALFDGLFQICRPKFITQHLHRGCGRVGKANREYFLCKAFHARQGGTSKSHNHFLYYGLRDLEEVNVELYDKEVGGWRLVPLESLLDDNDSTGKREIRFQLKWK